MANIEFQSIANQFHSEENNSVVFLINESYRIVAALAEPEKKYTIESCKEEWLASVTLCKKTFSSAELYEKQREIGTTSLFKRSSFLPKMVGKEDFLNTVDQLIKQVLTSKPLK